nr:cytidine deaminase [uncultured bacterium]
MVTPNKISDEIRQKLIQSAIEVRKRAYVPYSGYPVGAALLGDSGKVYEGINVENASFPLTNCAERSAVFSAVSQGERHFIAIAVVTENAGMPCGACRQVLYEFDPDAWVIVADTNGKIKTEARVTEILPGAFGPKDLPRR